MNNQEIISGLSPSIQAVLDHENALARVELVFSDATKHVLTKTPTPLPDEPPTDPDTNIQITGEWKSDLGQTWITYDHPGNGVIFYVYRNDKKIDGLTDKDGLIRLSQTKGSTQTYHIATADGKYVSNNETVVASSTAPTPEPEPDPEPTPNPTPIPTPTNGTKVPSGKSIPRTASTILLERGGTYNIDSWTVTKSLTIDVYGDPNEPEPLITTDDGTMFDIRVPVIFRNLQFKTTNDSSIGFITKSKDIRLENIMFVGGLWGDVLKIGSGTERLRIYGWGGTNKIIRHWCYDDSHGKSADIIIDLGGKTCPGSRDENCFRFKGMKGCILRNGTILSPPGARGNKAWVTVQAEPDTGGPSNILCENLKITGPAGGGPIKTASGWQNSPVTNLTFRNISSSAGGNFNIEEGARNVVFENITDYYAPDRAPLSFKSGNPNFSEKPNVTVRNCNFRGKSSSFASNAELAKIQYINSTWNGKAL